MIPRTNIGMEPVLLILVTLGVHHTGAVMSPLDKVTGDLSSLKETLESLHHNIAFLPKIQAQLSQLNTQLSQTLEPRLASLDVTVTGMEARVSGIEGRLQQVMPSLSSLQGEVTGIGASVKEINRKQASSSPEPLKMEMLLPNVDIRLGALDTAVEKLTLQVEAVDRRLVSVQEDVKGNHGRIQSVIDKVDTGLLGQGRRVRMERVIGRGGHRGQRNNSCVQNRKMLHNIQRSVMKTLEHIKNTRVNSEIKSNEVEGPRFEYLRSERMVGDAEVDMETRFKRINKRLSDMMILMQSSREERKNAMADLGGTLTETHESVMSQFESQTGSLASLHQCCSGMASDQARLSAQAAPVLDKMDRWMTSWQNSVLQQFQRMMQQNSYDSDSDRKEHKELERIVLQGFDRCQSNAGNIPEQVEESQPVSYTKKSPGSSEIMEDTDGRKPEMSDQPERGDWEEGCEKWDQVMSGVSSVLRLRGGESDIEEREGDMDYWTRYCDQITDGGGWTVIQRRGDYPGPRTNFTRSWIDYRNGFGSLSREFWWGNELISRLTSEGPVMELRVDLEAHDGRRVYAVYSTFRVEGEDADYQLWVGGYSGNASDSLSAHNGFKFSTVDRNNDEAPKCCPCAPAYGGGWWFYSCFESNLNGEYFATPDDNGYYRGIIWELWLGDYSLKSVNMMVRPRDFSHNTRSQDSLVRDGAMTPSP